MRGRSLSRPRFRRSLRGWLAMTIWILVLAGQAPSVLAHAAFLDSTPRPGQRVGTSPGEITLKFTEPLNQSLSKATIVNAVTRKRSAATKVRAHGNEVLVLRPAGPLPRAPYNVEWHTVSTVDGHALEGSFSFGVRAAAIGGEHEVEQSPLARDGWLRIAVRALFYGALFFFAGGLLNSVLLSRREPSAWLVPTETRDALTRAGEDREAFSARAWSRTLDLGWLAAGAAAATALVEAADASGSLSLSGARDYLLTNTAGLARVGTVIALAMAALSATRHRSVAAAWTAAALMTVAISGHANSADPRAGAVFTDWVHLLAGSVWIGGIAQVATTWLPQLGKADQELRSLVMRAVLERFGKVALPAFLVVAVSGSVNALIELGRVQAVWQTSYGRVLGLKIALVGLIALASYWHALRIRPRLLRANPHPSRRLDRRHWRLLSGEPVVALGVVAVAATLVAFPLPPRQLGEAGDEAAQARQQGPCQPCPLPKPRSAELAVANQAGSRIAAFWIRRNRDSLSGTFRLLDPNKMPVDAPVQLLGGELQPCGLGCWRLTVPGTRDSVTAIVKEKGRAYHATVPTRWRRDSNQEARRLLERAQSVMRRQRSLREREELTSGPGTFVRTLYRFQAPDRFAYSTSSGAESIVIGKRQWLRTEKDPWVAESFGGLTAFRTRDFFRWTPYAQASRLLDVRRISGMKLAEVALMDRATPAWFRLTIDLSTMRVLKDRMVTGAHFMDRRYFAFNAPVQLTPPAHSVRAR